MLILDTSQIFARATAHDVINTLATGGVCWPSAKFKVTTNPKWMGSIPAACISGITIGTTKKIAKRIARGAAAFAVGYAAAKATEL